MTGLDTETHKGRAVLVATPSEFTEPWRWTSRDRFLDLMEWLRKRDPEGFVCWNADYDVQAILKWLPRAIGERLHRFTRARYKDLRLRFVPGKFFTVHKGKRRIVAIYDLMQFYACKLDTAAEKYLQERKSDPGIPWDQILPALKGRQAGVRVKLIDYCLRDSELVQRLYNLSKQNMARVGVKFNRPVSCAALASQKFGKTFVHTIPKEINRAFEKTFRGGRMECLQVGFFPKAYLYDLHSAYPSVMAALPPIPEDWGKIKGFVRSDAKFAAVQVDIRIKDAATGAVPVLGPGGQLMYPMGVWRQWVDLDTYRILEKRGWIENVVKGWQAALNLKESGCPFAEMVGLYDERMRTPENAWAIKILLNSWYGKLAQRMFRWVRSRVVAGPGEFWGRWFWRKKEQWTKKTCFVYAAAITGGIRARLFEEIDPAKTIFYATDGVATTEPLSIPTGPGLGEWSDGETVSDLLVVGSGVYCYRDSRGNTRTKFRGFDVGLDLYRLLDSRSKTVEMTVNRNVTLAHALSQRRWKDFNQISEIPRYLDLNFDKKRRWERERTGRDLLKRTFQSEPWRYYGEVGA